MYNQINWLISATHDEMKYCQLVDFFYIFIELTCMIIFLIIHDWMNEKKKLI